MEGTDVNTTSAAVSRNDKNSSSDVTSGDAAHVLDAAACLLGQCGRIVEAMDDESYCCASTVLAGGTIGKHLRHTLDHFGAILTGTQRDVAIDYDHRARGVAVETDRSAAIEQIDGLRSGLTGLQNDLGGPVRIRVMLSGDGTEAELDSTWRSPPTTASITSR